MLHILVAFFLEAQASISNVEISTTNLVKRWIRIYIYKDIRTYIFFFFIFNKNVIEIKFSQGIYTGREKVESKGKRQYL